MGTHRHEAAIMEPLWVYIRPSAYTLWLLVWCFMGTLDSRSGMSLTFLPGLRTLSLLLGHLAQPLCEGLCLILLCFVVTVFGWCPGRDALFWGAMGWGKWVLKRGERELGGVEEGEIAGWNMLYERRINTISFKKGFQSIRFPSS